MSTRASTRADVRPRDYSAPTRLETTDTRLRDWPNMQPRRGAKMPVRSRSRASASLMMQTPKRLENGSPIRPASYEVLAMAGFRAQISKDDLALGPMPGRKTDGPPIQ